MKSIKGWIMIFLGCAVVILVGSIASSFATEDKWDTVGEKIIETSHAVGEATEESAQKAMEEAEKAMEEARKAWEDAKLKSKEALDAAKKKYDEEMEKARAKIHEATAPKTGAEVEYQGDADPADVTDKPAE